MFDSYGRKFPGNTSTLVKFENNISTGDLLRILDKEKLSGGKLTLNEYLSIAGVHIGAVKEVIADKLHRPITPYIHSGNYAFEEDRGRILNVFFFLGNNNFYTKHFGRYIASSNLMVGANEGITRNDLNIYDVRLVDPLKDICDIFSKARNLKCVSATKEENIGSTLWYHR